MRTFLILLLPVLTFLGACKQSQKQEGTMEDKLSKFAATEISYDAGLLDENQKLVVEKLYRASRLIDSLYLEQVYSRNIEIRDSLRSKTDRESRMKLEYFSIMFGLFDPLLLRSFEGGPLYGGGNRS